jgi:hypothetical protein
VLKRQARARVNDREILERLDERRAVRVKARDRDGVVTARGTRALLLLLRRRSVLLGVLLGTLLAVPLLVPARCLLVRARVTCCASGGC